MKNEPLEYWDWVELNYSEINCILAESGADRELDFDFERESEKLYEKYLLKQKGTKNMSELEKILNDQTKPSSLGVDNVKKLMLAVYVMDLEGYTPVLIIDQMLKQFGIELDEAEINSVISFLDFEAWLANKEVKNAS